jgi:hypothetical protein
MDPDPVGPNTYGIRIRNTGFGRFERRTTGFVLGWQILYDYAISHFRRHRLENQSGQFIGTSVLYI